MVRMTTGVNVWEGRSNAARKAIRTALQVTVGLVPALALLIGGLVGPEQALAISGILTTVATFAQNLLEDKGIIGTWLRRPSPSDAVTVVVEPVAQVMLDQIGKPENAVGHVEFGPRRKRLVRRPPSD